MRRRTIVIVLLLALALLSLMGLRFLRTHRTLSVDGFPLVRVGMLQAEVEDLFGVPPGKYGRYPRGSSFMTCEGYIAPAGSTEKVWCDDGHRFEIYFDGAGRVVGIHQRAVYKQGPPIARNWFDRVLLWLGL